jgi:quercetin dioxygenase-like cupin family protein
MDATQVDPAHYKVELENERVRVLRATYGPGEKSQLHSHPALIAVLLTDGHIRMHYPNGDSEVITAKAGQVLSMPALEHIQENLGDEPFEVILIELKS